MYAVQFKGEDFEIATATTTEEIRQLARARQTLFDGHRRKNVWSHLALGFDLYRTHT
jgi:hypothetical protein